MEKADPLRDRPFSCPIPKDQNDLRTVMPILRGVPTL